MKSLNGWLQEYSVSHQNHTNKLLHHICVPLIFFSILGMLWDLEVAGIRGAWVLAAFGMAFYVRLGWRVSLVMLLQISVCFAILSFWSQRGSFVFWPCLAIFVAAWIGQFVGHKIEGAKPSFFQDIQFLLIGPLWVFSSFLKK